MIKKIFTIKRYILKTFSNFHDKETLLVWIFCMMFPIGFQSLRKNGPESFSKTELEREKDKDAKT